VWFLPNEPEQIFFITFRTGTQSAPDFSVAEHYGLRNTTECVYSTVKISPLAQPFWRF
jgi:hypothetical protein